MIWYLHTCSNCGCRLRRSRTHCRKHGDQLALPMHWIDTQGNTTCNTATAINRRFVGSGTGHTPIRP